MYQFVNFSKDTNGVPCEQELCSKCTPCNNQVLDFSFPDFRFAVLFHRHSLQAHLDGLVTVGNVSCQENYLLALDTIFVPLRGYSDRPVVAVIRRFVLLCYDVGILQGTVAVRGTTAIRTIEGMA